MRILSQQIRMMIDEKALRGFQTVEECTPEETTEYLSGNTLPDNILAEKTHTGEIKLYKAVGNSADYLYIEYLLNKTSKWVTFFGVLAIIGIILACISGIVMLQNFF